MSTANLQSHPPGQGHRRSIDSAAGQEVFLPPPDPTALRTNSPYRYNPHDIFVTSTEEVQSSQQSPPTYHRVPTSSQVALDSRSFTDLETPPYRSRVNLAERDEKSANNPMPEDEKPPLKGVHYPSDLNSPPAHRPAIIRVDSDAPSVAGTDDEQEEDSDYDWDGEEDLVDEEAKFEERMGKKKQPKGWGPRRIITFLFSSLIGSMFLAGLLIAVPILLNFYWYKKNPTESRRYTLNNIEAWLFWAAANLIVSWWLALIIDLVPVVFLTSISIGWGHISEGVKDSVELFNGIKNTIKPIFYGASMWVSWVIIFQGIFKLYDGGSPQASKAAYTERTYQAIQFLFFLALVISIQRMILQAIAQTFHRTAYKERLDSVSESLRVIETLRDYKPVKSHQKKPSGARTPALFSMVPTMVGSRQNSRPISPVVGFRDDGHMADNENEDSPKSKGKRRSMLLPNLGSDPNDPSVSMTSMHSYPPTPARSGANTPTRRRDSHDADDAGATAVVTQAAKVLKTAVLHDARNLKGKDSADKALMWDVTNSAEAKRLARLIYFTFRQGRRKYLLPEDFHPAFPTPEEAQKAFRVFDEDDNGDISRSEIKTVLLKVYKERRFLSRSMRDVGAALKTLDRILLFFALVILFFISLSVFGVDVGKSLTSVYSIGIAASFIFKNAASGAFDAIMFLFVTHPFDTGDRCFIGDENLVVKKMGLFATVFTRADGTETYYFNSQLFSMFITNARRSGKTFEGMTMKVAWNTPMEKLNALETCMNEWLQTEEHRWFEPSTSVAFQHIHYQRHLEFTMGIGHNGNWQDWGLRLARKTAFHAAAQYFCRQLGIIAAESPIPIVYAERDKQIWENPNFFPADVDDGSSVINMQQQPGSPRSPKMPWTPAHSSGLAAGHGSKEKVSWLGFEPPTNQPSALRARRAKSKKSALRSHMGDGDN